MGTVGNKSPCFRSYILSTFLDKMKYFGTVFSFFTICKVSNAALCGFLYSAADKFNVGVLITTLILYACLLR